MKKESRSKIKDLISGCVHEESGIDQCTDKIVNLIDRDLAEALELVDNIGEILDVFDLEIVGKELIGEK